jgi:uncharacterized protein YdaU (DUF1376 family)
MMTDNLAVRIWWPLYAADFAIDTQHLTAEETGAYVRLLNAAWRTGGALRLDPQRLARVAGIDDSRWGAVFSSLADFFESDGGDYLVSKLLGPELSKARLNREKKSAAANTRWASKDAPALHTHCTKDAPALQVECPASASSPTSSPAPSTTPKTKAQKRGAPFVAPSLVEVTRFCREAGFPDFDAELFHDQCTAVGWAGRRENWKALVRNIAEGRGPQL